ncbi:MAG: hypothetical protein AAFQ58_09000 [Pseudomonadota bacterium]
MTSDLTTAADISEHLLAQTGDAMMSDDFDSFATRFFLPYTIETVDGQRAITTRADLKTTFIAVRAHLVKHQVTLMARHCVSASFRGPDEVAATHETRLISRDILVQDPYPAFSVLKRQDSGDWQITYTSYVIIDSAELNGALNA